MYKVLLICGAGMSTSILVSKMQEADINNEYTIKCCDITRGMVLYKDYDIILLAPHMSYMHDDYKALCDLKNIPLIVVSSKKYMEMDGQGVLNDVQDNLETQTKVFKVVLLHAENGAISHLLHLDMSKKLVNEEKQWVIETYQINNFYDKEVDIVLLEPQIRYELKTITKRLGSNTIVKVAPMELYATFDGRKVLNYIHKLKEENRNEINNESR